MNKLMVYYYDLVFDLLSTELGCKLKDFGNMLKDGAQAQEGFGHRLKDFWHMHKDELAGASTPTSFLSFLRSVQVR